MDRIGLKQQFRKRTMEGVDGCKGPIRFTIRYQISRMWSPLRLGQRKGQRQRLLRRLQNQNRGQGKSKQDQKKKGDIIDGCKDKRIRETSSMGSAGGLINCARLPEPSHCLYASTDHQQQQRLLNPIFPCFFPSKAGFEGHTVSCFSPFEQEQGRSYTFGSSKEIPWSQRIIVCQFGTCHPYIIALFSSCNLFRITLLNPISGHEITLPGSPLSWFDFEGGLRFALSLPHLSPPYYTVFIIFRCSESKLLLCRKGDRHWTVLNLPWHVDSFNTFRGDLYALRESDEARYLLAVYNTRPTLNFHEFCMDTSQLPPPKAHRHFLEYHLVESPNGEELLLVLQIITPEERGDGFSSFHVFKADLSRKMWIRKETLGDHVLIILDRQSLFLSAASVGHEVKGNCIFFSRLSATGHPPLKMFDLDSETMTDVSIPFPSSRYGQVMFVRRNICC